MEKYSRNIWQTDRTEMFGQFSAFYRWFLHPVFAFHRKAKDPLLGWRIDQKLPLKIKYSSPHISTAEQTVEKGRKPLKIKGLRRFFSGKDRGKCENFTPDFGVKRGNFPRFPLSLGKISVEKWTIWWNTLPKIISTLVQLPITAICTHLYILRKNALRRG